MTSGHVLEFQSFTMPFRRFKIRQRLKSSCGRELALEVFLQQISAAFLDLARIPFYSNRIKAKQAPHDYSFAVKYKRWLPGTGTPTSTL